MIEIKKSARASVSDHIIVIDKQELPSSDVFETKKATWFAMIGAPHDSRQLFPFRLSDIEKSVSQIIASLDEQVDRWLRLTSATLVFETLPAESSYQNTRFVFTPDFNNWASPFSASAYIDAFRAAAKDSELADHVTFESDITNGFNLNVFLKDKDWTFQTLIRETISPIKLLSNIAAKEALRNVRNNSLVTWFNFPAPIKASCEQYLIYFLQFLEDLGIKANSEIKEDAGRVLFSVTPVDGPSALGKIKEALEVYLDLPRNQEFNAAVDEFSNIAVSQLKANVFFLKSQLSLAHAMLEAKNATIDALKLSVFRQQQMLTGSNPSQDVQPDEKDCEPILGDTVHLTKYEGKFLKVDLPTILRRLKRSFGIDKDKE